MTKFINSMLLGVLLFMPIDMFFYAGMKIGYLDTLEIVEYFNPFFVQHQVWYAWILGLCIGMILYVFEDYKKFAFAYLGVLLLSMVFMVPNVGYYFGELFFYKKDVRLEIYSKTKVKTDLYYKSREHVYLKALKGEKIIKIELVNVKFLD